MLIAKILDPFFNWLYHPLAFTYDFVSGVVSFGRWNDWVHSVIPLIEGRRVLELGHGPGYLQRSLRNLDLFAVGLDESAQMSRLAARRLKAGSLRIDLARGLAQTLPFPANAFDTIVSTFPSRYIVEAETLSEAKRTLRNGGRLIVLIAAWPMNPLLGWLFRVTGEAPSEAFEIVEKRMQKPFAEAGFEVNIQNFDVKSGKLLIVLARKRSEL